MLLPLHLLTTAFLGLLSLAVPILGVFLLYRAVRQKRRRFYTTAKKDNIHSSPAQVPPSEKPVLLELAWSDRAVLAPLATGVLLLLFSLLGEQIVRLAFPVGGDDPKQTRNGTVQNLPGVAGANLHIEIYGPQDGPILVLTHGWGMNSTEWYYAKRDLADHFRMIVWDLPGLGASSPPTDGDFALETLARDLHSVVGIANGKPVILVGHSIGGMINLTFCRLYPAMLGHEVSAMIQIDTSYTNPVKTTSNSSLSQALQKPVGEPILWAMVGLSPLVRLMNWMSYLNGTTNMMNAKSAFAGSETRGQLDFVSRLQTEASPGVVARGTLGMFHWDAAPVLAHITVPVLLLVGQQDSTTLPSASQYMRDSIPRSQLTVIDPSRHYALLEQNQRVDAAIRKFASAH